jgi:hypothetical protein
MQPVLVGDCVSLPVAASRVNSATAWSGIEVEYTLAPSGLTVTSNVLRSARALASLQPCTSWKVRQVALPSAPVAGSRGNAETDEAVIELTYSVLPSGLIVRRSGKFAP